MNTKTVLSLILLSALNIGGYSTAQAAVFSYTDQGLDFEINTDDPLAATISFADQAVEPTLGVASRTIDIVRTSSVDQPFPNPPLVINNRSLLTVNITSVSSASDILITGPQSSDLSFVSDNVFEFDGAFDVISDEIMITGNWTIEGDTETVGGEFSLVSQAQLRGGPSGIRTDQFPDAVFLTSGLNVSFNFGLISTFVNGENFNFNVVMGLDDGQLSLTQIPVPPAFYLFVSALTGLFGMKRRRS